MLPGGGPVFHIIVPFSGTLIASMPRVEGYLVGGQHGQKGICQAGQCSAWLRSGIYQGPLSPLFQLDDPQPFLHGGGLNCLSNRPCHPMGITQQDLHFSLPYKLKQCFLFRHITVGGGIHSHIIVWGLGCGVLYIVLLSRRGGWGGHVVG